ncbi:MAG: biotin/lipoyl-binding protein [Planctomycetes bacterium]|nr:biotin/lipoyl-binding protein [Planctomycetota bacterium]
MKYFAKFGDIEREFHFDRSGGQLRASCGDRSWNVDLAMVGDGAFSLIVDGRCYDCLIDREEGHSVVQVRGERMVIDIEDERERAAHALASARTGGRQIIEASMPGIVVDVKVEVGQRVEAGQTVVVLEAMKMQNPLAAEADGIVSSVLCKKGLAVAGGAALVEIDPPPEG